MVEVHCSGQTSVNGTVLIKQLQSLDLLFNQLDINNLFHEAENVASVSDPGTLRSKRGNRKGTVRKIGTL